MRRRSSSGSEEQRLFKQPRTADHKQACALVLLIMDITIRGPEGGCEAGARGAEGCSAQQLGDTSMSLIRTPHAPPTKEDAPN